MTEGPAATPSTIEVTMDNGTKVVIPYSWGNWDHMEKMLDYARHDRPRSLEIKSAGQPHSIIVMQKVSSARVIW